MPKVDALFEQRKCLREICKVPDRIISVYSLEKHVWADGNAPEARKERRPELQTIEEFRIDPVRPFLNDVLRNLAAPYHPQRRDQPVGQGYWIQAEFGSGKSHLLCFLAALALGRKEAWDIVRRKEEQGGRGKRESLYRFWEEGLESKCTHGKKGPLIVVRTLVGTGSGTVGLNDRGRTLADYILEAVKEALEAETGKNLSLYPAEILADRFLQSDLARYRADLKKFLRDPRFFEEDEFEDVDEFLRDIQGNQSPDYKRSCGNKLWRFYTDYLKVHPHVAAETEDILKHLVETVLAEGYAGLLLMLDEVSLFMKNRDDAQRADDEKTLVVLSNRLAKVHNLPVWTICAAQQAIESKLGVKNIIADDRLKLVPLLQNDQDYYDIVLNRVREISNPEAIANYYAHYKQRFAWAAAMGEKDFTRFFPFHQPAVEVLRAITYELTTARSAIHFMHQTLKHQIKQGGRDLIRLWELFDEAVRYEEDPSNLNAAIVAIKTKREADFRAYEASRRQIDNLTTPFWRVHRDKGLKTVQTLFLYHVARTRQQGLTPEEVANSVLIARDAEASIEENVLHYETLAENLKKELQQIAQSYDEDRRPRYRFEPVSSGIDPRAEFKKARDDAEVNPEHRRKAWEHLLALDEWLVKTRQMTLDLSHEVKSIFRQVVPASWTYGETIKKGDQEVEVVWKGRQTTGLVGMRDLAQVARDHLRLPPIDTDQTDRDFACFISTGHATEEAITKVLERTKDPRVVLWSPAELKLEEHERLLNFAAYRKLVADWEQKDTEDALAVIHWVANSLQSELGSIYRIVPDCYARGRIDALNHRKLEPNVAGELTNIVRPLVERVLNAAYESREIQFEAPFVFRKEEGVKVINGIVRSGAIPKGKTNQNISAAQNFGFGLKIIKKASERTLDVTDNRFVQDIWKFIDAKLADNGQTMKIETFYKNFMGLGGPRDYGLTRRMVQIYLLCLAREGRIRIGLGPRSGLAHTQLDYANIADVEFSAAVLASLADVQKMARPENWDVLRPYAEKLLDRAIPATYDEAAIAADRKQLRDLFAEHKEIAPRLQLRARELLGDLGVPNPYEAEMGQAAKLFATDISGGDDIQLILHGLKEAYDYRAFDANHADPQEVDDLANRLRNYRDMGRFLGYEREIRTAYAYSQLSLPAGSDWKIVRRLQRDELAKKLADLRPFIDSDARLRTELLGHVPPEPGERGTLGRLIHEYTTLYAALHDTVLGQVEAERTRIENLVNGETLRACQKLEGITALQPKYTAALKEELTQRIASLFTCSSPARGSVEERLRLEPVHDCGMTADDANQRAAAARATAAEAERHVQAFIQRKLELFLNPGIRQRLEQGRKEPLIQTLLACETVEAVQALLVPAVLKSEEAVSIINRYLKRITVKPVRLTDFRPNLGTVEREQVTLVVEAFERFLVAQFADLPTESDALPMLRLE